VHAGNEAFHHLLCKQFKVLVLLNFFQKHRLSNIRKKAGITDLLMKNQFS
jgi:hypothetical protein